MTDIAWGTTGQTVEVPGHVDRIPEYDPRSGDHLWIMTTAYRVDPQRLTDPDAGPGLLGQENLLLLSGPGCYYCEQPYTPRLLHRRCPGEPAS